MILFRRILIVVTVIVQGWVAISWTRVDGLFRAGMRAHRARDGVMALARFQEALAIRSSEAVIWAWSGDVALDRGDLDRAWASYAGAVLRCPLDSWSWSGLASVALLRAERTERQNGVNLSRLGARVAGTLDVDRAIALTAGRLATRLKPSGFVELDVLAAVYESIGDVERARETFRTSARMMPAPSYHDWGAGERLPTSTYEAILAGLREGIAKAPEFERSTLCLEAGRFALAQDDLVSARGMFEEASRRAANDYEAFHPLVGLADVHEREGRLGAALQALEAASMKGFDRAAIDARIGRVQRGLGKHDEACALLRTALRESPLDRGLRFDAAAACEAARDADSAETILREGLGRPSEDIQMAKALLDFYTRAGRRNSKLNLLREWVSDEPDHPELRMLLEQAQAEYVR